MSSGERSAATVDRAPSIELTAPAAAAKSLSETGTSSLSLTPDAIASARETRSTHSDLHIDKLGTKYDVYMSTGTWVTPRTLSRHEQASYSAPSPRLVFGLSAPGSPAGNLGDFTAEVTDADGKSQLQVDDRAQIAPSILNDAIKAKLAKATLHDLAGRAKAAGITEITFGEATIVEGKDSLALADTARALATPVKDQDGQDVYSVESLLEANTPRSEQTPDRVKADTDNFAKRLFTRRNAQDLWIKPDASDPDDAPPNLYGRHDAARDYLKAALPKLDIVPLGVRNAASPILGKMVPSHVFQITSEKGQTFELKLGDRVGELGVDLSRVSESVKAFARNKDRYPEVLAHSLALGDQFIDPVYRDVVPSGHAASSGEMVLSSAPIGLPLRKERGDYLDRVHGSWKDMSMRLENRMANAILGKSGLSAADTVNHEFGHLVAYHLHEAAPEQYAELTAGLLDEIDQADSPIWVERFDAPVAKVDDAGNTTYEPARDNRNRIKTHTEIVDPDAAAVVAKKVSPYGSTKLPEMEADLYMKYRMGPAHLNAWTRKYNQGIDKIFEELRSR